MDQKRLWSAVVATLLLAISPAMAQQDETPPADAPEDQVEEVIVATPLNVEGEATALYVAETLRGTTAQVSRIASGVPHGGELEFTDQVTLGRALEGRKRL